MAEGRQLLAIYDLDRTVSWRPTYSLFLLKSAALIAPARLLLVPLVPLLMIAHKLGAFDRDQLKSAMWAVMLGRVPAARMARAIDAFTAATLARNIRPGARAQIERDRADGARLVLATAAHEVYAAPIARQLGFDFVVATQVRVGDDGRVGPGLAGANVYGNSKLAAVEQFLIREALVRDGLAVRFYSDSSSDRPVFEWADEPMAVNPSRKLARLAAERGWPVADWQRP
ncbi:HAD-IB family phosphatase [Sphingosinicella sp. LHD-64]|uniref:HAD family hydrolase n=1 Tax=Sphingosinicella sp. LHD-64 TaxID=3072139 RepID=UPI0028104ABC|nr:HAD-IB family phosphatase [Sphingosinicella sp. LHD-64]MDQ8756374.1 HAD-IB family phosphatase [Sphingosinicella sp. LHD-64]